MAEPDSDSPSTVTLPSAEPSDSEEVARALKLAQMLWEEGQQREAVRTLQRGAAAAEEVGNDLRALTLARCAADLSAQLGTVSGSTPPAGSVPPAAAPPATAPGAFPAPGSTPAPPEVMAALSSPPSSTGPNSSVPSTTPYPPGVSGVAPVTARSLRPVATNPRKSESPSSPVAAAVPVVAAGDAEDRLSSDLVVPVVVADLEGEAPASAPPVSDPVSAPPVSTPPVSTTVVSPTTASNSVRPMGRVATVPSIVPERQPAKIAPRATNGTAGLAFPVNARELRVAVKRSALDETLFVVRPLAPGARAPAGCREATLVFSEVDPE